MATKKVKVNISDIVKKIDAVLNKDVDKKKPSSKDVDVAWKEMNKFSIDEIGVYLNNAQSNLDLASLVLAQKLCLQK